MIQNSLFAEVILPLPITGTFTYLVPKKIQTTISNGVRVTVPFGSKKIYAGIVESLHTHTKVNTKEIMGILDEAPIVNSHQLRFFKWISEYYLCPLGEVLNAALPTALKLASESMISIQQQTKINPLEEEKLNEKEFTLLLAVKKKNLSLHDVGHLIGTKHAQPVTKQLFDKGYIDIFETLKEKYKPKTEKRVKLIPSYNHPDALQVLLEQLETQVKQQDVVLSYLRHCNVLDDPEINETGMTKKALLKEGISDSSLNTLIKKNIFTEWDARVPRFPTTDKSIKVNITLNPSQQHAKEQINQLFLKHDAVLLHGITGSGKTFIYVELIKEQLEKGKQVLYLLPEIALTTQIASILYKIFGNNFGVYHSKYSDNERVDIWNKVLNREFQFVLGVRSAIFLPFKDLGLIIVDEEHEYSFKQFDNAPKYHARDAALYLATLHKANILLGTATPSLESYNNAKIGKYGWVQLSERYGNSYIPQIIIADLKKEKKLGKLKGNLSSILFDEITEALSKKEQVILFQNRRGYAAYITCEVCAHTPTCPNCAVSLTYHQFNNRLVCHYCGYNCRMYGECTQCESPQLKNIGFGTEEIEEEIKILFPDAIVQRMDLDTTRTKYGYQRIIQNFEDGNIDILIGTQIVSKGLHFERVNLVGIFDTDRMMHYPDFRSHERAFQLIAQVSGRAGRNSQKGKVIIQTTNPNNGIIHQIKNEDLLAFYQKERLERQKFKYPPFCRLIKIIFKHKEKKTAAQGAAFYTKLLIDTLGEEAVNGPSEPIISKIRNQYLYDSLVRTNKNNTDISHVKNTLLQIRSSLRKNQQVKGVNIIFDVDPM